jgi:hypothetical protein
MNQGETTPAGVRSGKKSQPGIDAEAILRELTSRQHLEPHRPLRDVVSDLTDCTGVCPVAAERALTWLGLDGGRAVGRLRRGELSQLARSVHRFWGQALAAEATSEQPQPQSHSNG